MALNDAKLGARCDRGQGEVTADLAGQVPQVAGRLDLGAVDLNPYLPPATAGRGAATGWRAGGDRWRAQPPGAKRRRDWSDEPIALPPIGGANVDFALSRRRSRCAICSSIAAVLGLTPRRARAWASICRRSRSTAARAAARLDVDVVDGVPAIRHQFRLEGLQALPFLTAAAGFQRLERHGAGASSSLQTQGRHASGSWCRT